MIKDFYKNLFLVLTVLRVICFGTLNKNFIQYFKIFSFFYKFFVILQALSALGDKEPTLVFVIGYCIVSIRNGMVLTYELKKFFDKICSFFHFS